VVYLSLRVDVINRLLPLLVVAAGASHGTESYRVFVLSAWTFAKRSTMDARAGLGLSSGAGRGVGVGIPEGLGVAEQVVRFLRGHGAERSLAGGRRVRAGSGHHRDSGDSRQHHEHRHRAAILPQPLARPHLHQAHSSLPERRALPLARTWRPAATSPHYAAGSSTATPWQTATATRQCAWVVAQVARVPGGLDSKMPWSLNSLPPPKHLTLSLRRCGPPPSPLLASKFLFL
jgi:hypothetical protein